MSGRVSGSAVDVTVGVLGVTEARDASGAQIELGTPKQRALLAALALQRGRPVSVGALEEILWADEPPAAVAASLQAYVSGLRKALEPGRPPRTPAQVVVTAVPGYALRIPAEALDSERFVAAVTAVHRGLGQDADSFDGAVVGPADAAALARDRATLEGALALWRGEPYADLADASAAVAERARLDDLRLVALLDVAGIRLAMGEHGALAAELAPLRHEFPLHEGVAARQVLAEYRCGRQADALATLRAVRDELGETLGVDPGPALQALELAVLRQDPALDWHAPREGTVVDAPSVASAPAPDASGDAAALQTGDPRVWPVVGRAAELAALTGQLDSAASGQTGFTLLVGEPGIGKTRLVEEVMAKARAAGFLALAGRCSEDEGAPPLWPWRRILGALHEQVTPEQWREWFAPHVAHLADLVPAGALEGLGAWPDVSGESEAEQRFRVWDAVTALLVTAAAERPVLVVLDDLHWADVSSLKLLRHLAQSVPEIRLVVMGTRRANPEPQGALAEVGEAVARRHGQRLDLVGLDAADVVELVRAAGGEQPSAEAAEALRARTDGNPFFVVELVRWQAASGSHAQDVPTLVSDVVTRRVDQLPTVTRQVVRSAAVLGRTFDLDVLGEVRDEDEDDVLDALDPAVAAGIVFESRTRVGQFRFAHALVQEAVYHGMSAVRRARQHAEAAQALAARPAEAAHHWLAAGPAHAGNAWRAASLAAEEARRVFGHEEVARLLGAALQAQRDDPTATPEERYELLMRRSDACRWAADVRGLDACLAEAIEVAQTMGDYERMARAAVGTTEGSLWSTRDYGIVDAALVGALDTVLRELPAGDGELRCRAMLSLASELFYGDEPERQEALLDEGLAMARRLGDPRLRLWALQTAFVARWRSRFAEQRLALAVEAVELAESLGDETAEAMVRSLRAAAAQELGDVDVMRTDMARVRAIAGPRRLAFPLLLLGWMEVPWLAMAGDFAAAEELFARTLAVNETTTVRQRPEVVFGALLSLRYWQGRTDELLPMIDAMGDSPMRVIALTKVFLLAHTGRVDEARAVASEQGVDPATFPISDDWLTVVTLYQVARIAVAFEDRAACATSYERLSPFAGRVVSAGSAAAMGTVEATLGLLAAALGERELASSHADRATAQLKAWDVPMALAELSSWRERYAF